MGAEQLNVLLIEDNPDHAALIQRHLAGLKSQPILPHWVTTLAAGLDLLAASRFDALLLDLLLPDSDSSHTLPRVVEKAPGLPVIVLTAVDDMDLATHELREGAQDYLVKAQISGELLLRSIRYAIERKQSRTKLERYAAELERSNREFEQFAGIIAHDLKSPMSVVAYSLKLLQKKYAQRQEPESDRLIEGAVAAIDRMKALMDDLFEYARAGSGGKKAFEKVDAQMLLNQAVANLQVQIDESAAALTSEPLPTVLADPPQLMQLFQNLLGNAIKYRNQATPRIHVAAQRAGDHWLFSVRDNGIGIDPQHKESVFALFKRLHNDAKIPGTGLGLAVCQKIVERHGGQIWVEGEPGRGSTFFFTLPLA